MENHERSRDNTVTLSQMIKAEDCDPAWLLDAAIISALAYSNNPHQELHSLHQAFELPETAKYDFFENEELRNEGLESCNQDLLVAKSLSHGHMIVACRGTKGFMDVLTNLNIIQRPRNSGVGAAHGGFLGRAESIPLKYLRRLLIRGHKIVVTGHSLGGAVASLLSVALLESIPRWCHEQLHCYKFGCPDFADSSLANHVNSRYRKHLVHIVSSNDIVPKAMRLFHILVTQLVSRLVVAIATPRLSGLPSVVCEFIRRFALSWCYHSGRAYAFAGQMVLLDDNKSSTSDEYDLDKYCDFQLIQSVSINGMKEHNLHFYIGSLQNFCTQAKELGYSNCKSEPAVHRNGINITLKKERKSKSLRSLVASVIFVKRMQECSPRIRD